MRGSVSRRLGLMIKLSLAAAALVVIQRNTNSEKHLRVVVPGRLIRGAGKRRRSLRAIIARERIKTIVTLTAINRDDPKYVGQAKVVCRDGRELAHRADARVDGRRSSRWPRRPTCWPIRRQPVFFHCVAGHHRTSLAHAAYLIRHCGWSAEAAWKEVASLPWARPAATADQNDRALIDEFARVQRVDEARNAGHSRPRFTMTTQSRSRRIPDRLVRLGGRDRRRRCSPTWPGTRRITTSARSRPGPIYRSGQMPASALAQTIREHGSRPSLTCEGRIPRKRGIATSWRRPSSRERPRSTSRCRRASGCRVPSFAHWSRPSTRRNTRADPLPWGSERTGLASAFAELLRPGSTLDDARAQFSIRYLFVRVNDGKVMAEHLDQYENWLREQRGGAHARPTFAAGSTRDSSPVGPVANNGHMILSAGRDHPARRPGRDADAAGRPETARHPTQR